MNSADDQTISIYGRTEAITPELLERGPKDGCGVPEILRYEINRLLSRAYAECRSEQRRIFAFKIEVNTHLPRDFDSILIYIRALTEPIVWDEP